MTIRIANPDDAPAITAIYAPIVRDTVISFELEAPAVAEMRQRIATTLRSLPWLVSVDAAGKVDGYVYASRHRERAAYQWSVDVTAYVRSDARRQGIGQSLYRSLFDELASLGYYQAFAGIALPNPASVALHESVGFEPVGVKVARAIIEHSREVWLAADHSKFNRPAMVELARLDELDTLFTDAAPPAPFSMLLAEAGVQLTVSPA